MTTCKLNRILVVILSLTVALIVQADSTELGDIALHQALLDLDTNLSLMCVAAHPDDEDDATLALYRMKYGVRTIAVIATRGEGGQNEIGPELYNDLGVIRTREMMRASKVIGADLHFLNLPEFGFSKTPEEGFEVWGHDETVRRLVRVIRLTQPTVIITNHGTQKDHGHHQAIGIALQEAALAAGDPNKFSELEQEGLTPWRPEILYLRAWGPNLRGPYVDINQLDEIRGKTYAQIAADALAEHKSQGMGFFINYYLEGKVRPTYTHVNRYVTSDHRRSGTHAFPLLEERKSELGVAPSLPLDEIQLKEILGRETKLHPDANQYVRNWDVSRRSRVAACAREIQLSAQLATKLAVAGQTVTVAVTVSDFGESDINSANVSLEFSPWFAATPSDPVALDLTQSRTTSSLLTFAVPQSAPQTVPEGEHLFEPNFLEPQAFAVARVNLPESETPVELRIPLTLKIAPRVEANMINTPLLVRRKSTYEASIDVLVKNHAQDQVTGNVMLSVAPGFLPEATTIPYDLPIGGERIYSVRCKIGDNLEPRDYLINTMVEGDTRDAPGIARLVDVAVPEGVRVGVVQSYDNTFMTVLEKLGIPHEALTIEDFSQAKLDTFSTIIIDIRAYLVRPDLAANNQALLDYVSRGGTLIVNYQKTEEWKPQFAPYPITLSRNRVTREDAPVKLLVPDHAVFTTPNAIAPEDWEGWIQERGLYFPSEWDAAYTPLIEVNDPGESNSPGSLLIAKHGEGNYVYNALVLYRQIRELHPGALRLFTNLIALGKPR
ncbi:MAG: PIG-L family deacetylase [Candidatus Hydrogenedentes bacterium]|nr:PIG-L family deacetylase [Candidatus Hydrogenedentota bacterium]